MAAKCAIPGYESAIESEQRDRSLSFLGLPSLIAGVEIIELTPLRLEWLRASGNPFICGGSVSGGAIVQFLWLLNKRFHPKTNSEAFIASKLHLDYERAVNDIDAYLETTFLDAPYSEKHNTPYCSSAASLIYAMACDPFRWTMEQTLRSPLRVIYQLIKCHDKANGVAVVNRRSDLASKEFMMGIESGLRDGSITQKDLDRINGGDNARN